MSRQKKLPAAVIEVIEERETRAWELRNLIRCVEVAETARSDYGCEVEDFKAALRGLVTFADQLHLSLDADAFADAVADIEADSARERAREAREEADEAAERRTAGRALRVVSNEAAHSDTE